MNNNQDDKIYRNPLNEDLLDLEEVSIGFIDDDNNEDLEKNKQIDNDFNEIENIRSFLKSTDDNAIEFEEYDVHKENLIKNKAEFREREEFIKESLKPTRDYEDLPEQKVVPVEKKVTSRYKKEKIKSTITLFIIFVLFLLSISFLLHVDEIVPSGRDLNKSKTLYTNTNSIEVDGNLVSYSKSGDTITILIENNDSRINYDVRGSYLLLNEKAYFPKIEQNSTLQQIAFGETAEENENIKGVLFFDKNKLNSVEYFVVSDILINAHSYDIFFEL